MKILHLKASFINYFDGVYEEIWRENTLSMQVRATVVARMSSCCADLADD
jgi:hypothetical protein